MNTKKVDFIIPGAMKCGTSSLAKLLMSHPDIVFSSPKEPQFFAKAKNWKDELAVYENYFKKEGRIRGEGSTSYTMYPWFNLGIWNHIYEYNPDMKFIYLVRNPIDRFVSHYMHLYERGYIDCSLDETFKQTPLMFYVSRYYMQISPYIDRFGKDNVLLIDFDDFNNFRSQTVKQVSAFLDIDFDKFSTIDTVHINKSVGGYKKHYKYDNPSGYLKVIKNTMPKFVWHRLTDNSKRAFTKKPTLSVEQKQIINQYMKLDVLALQELMQKDLSHWFEID